MDCTLITSIIINQCAAVRGLSPTAWVLPYYGTKYYGYNPATFALGDSPEVFSFINENSATFSKISAVKYALNAGADVVVSEVRNNAYKHYFSVTIAPPVGLLDELDKMDGIIVIVKDNNGKYLVFGAENGLWKTSQTKRANDNTGLITIEYASREGIEETFSEAELNPYEFVDWTIEHYLNETSNGRVYSPSTDYIESTAFFYYRSALTIEGLEGATWVQAASGTAWPIAGYTEYIYTTDAGIIIS